MAPRINRSSRGRGQGRGNASAATAGSQEGSQAHGVSAAEPSTTTLQTEALPTEALPTATPPTDAPPTGLLPTETPPTFFSPSATQNQENDSHFPSPNSSPAPAPTETPAPTPVRTPVQRLDSLGLSGRGGHGIGSGVGGRVMAGKFKPKAVTRRALADRVQAQQEEEERRREREIEAQKERDISSYGRMQGIVYSGSKNRERGGMRGIGRGRGEVMGRGGINRNTKTQREASGLFGIAPAASAKKTTTAPPRTSTTRAIPASDVMDVDAQSTTSSLNAGVSRLNTKSTTLKTSPTSTRVKQDPDTLVPSRTNRPTGVDYDAQSAKVKVEAPDPIYPEEQEEGSRPAPRVDIEQINLITDDEDDYSDVVHSSRNKGKGRSLLSKGGLKPVRLQREEHRERVTLVNTEPAVSTLTDDAKEPSDYQAYVSTDDEEEDEIEFSRASEKWSGVWRDDEIEVKHDPGASVDAMDVDAIADPTILSENSQVSTGQVNDGKDPVASPSVGKDKTKRRRRPKNVQPVLQTEEDRAEHARYLEDLRVLAEELGGVQINSMNEKDARTIDVDGELTAGQPRVKDHEGRLYLFQFPPSLPTLVNKIKKEEVTDGGPDLMEVEAGPSSATEAIDLTKPDPEEAVAVETPHGTVHVPSEMVTEEGFAGKLIVRKSGRVQLDWGGLVLELGRGVQSDYLTTTMIVERRNEGGLSDASTKPVGTGTGMGKVMGNFVLKPDFEAMGLM